MGQTFSGGIGIATGFKLQDPQPIDDRMSVDTFTDLATLPNKYDGLTTYVKDEKTHYKYNGVSWELLSSGGVLYEELTYDELDALKSANDLNPGQFYLMTDFQTIYDQPDYSDVYTPKAVVVTKAAAIDPIVLLATSTNTFAKEVWRPSTPKHKLEYDFDFKFTEAMNEAAKGRITKCIDEFNNETQYDHTVVLFKRYESVSGSGIYNSFWDTGFGSVEVPTFGSGSSNNRLGTSGFGAGGSFFILGNNTFGDHTTSNTFGDHTTSNTFGNSTQSNTFGDYTTSNTFGNSTQSNTFGDYTISNTFGNYTTSNTFGNYTTSNTFGDHTTSNTFYNNTQKNEFGNRVNNNVFKEAFKNNTFEDDTNDNIFGNGFANNTFASNTKNNIFGNNVINTDLSAAATHVYQDYLCEIFKREDGAFRLRYTDSADAFVTVNLLS